MSKRVRAPADKAVKKTTKKAKVYTYSPKNLLGNSTKLTHKYVEILQLNPGAAGIPATYVFSANGLFDPNITGIGHQPRGFDQIKVLFDHYYVTKSTIKVTFMSGGSQGGSAICGIQLKDDNVAGANMCQEMENRNCCYGGLPWTSSVLTKQLTFNSKSFFDIKDRQLYGDQTTNPADQAYFIIFAQPTHGADIGAIDVFVEISYETTWSEPNDVAAS